jgi:hypothetical protein
MTYSLLYENLLAGEKALQAIKMAHKQLKEFEREIEKKDKHIHYLLSEIIKLKSKKE